ncbi:MAG: SusC/RagA family TonB-linked outer membrane protein [Prevotellaceae bacterium]|jgi:TonB-linked SusC/RagA family outer membrane protein|nr:SusC/RagA family TonB-linked outer membrane protein [Prevotellaceae bacterium]
MKQLSIIVLCLFVNIGVLHSQTRITGKVTDAETGEPLPFVSVSVKGTTTGTQTDESGNYSISLSNNTAVLSFSFVGYTTVEQSIDNRTIINVELRSEAESLDQVVVTAMGISRLDRALGYSAQEVKADKLTQTRQTDLNNALVGKVSGARFWTASAATFDAGRIILRGSTSLSTTGASGNEPIYIVDGVITNNNSVNMDDVESVNVLKGPAATALYGSRGGNGAVIITTKRAASGKGEVSFSQTLAFDVIDMQMKQQSLYGGGALGADGEFMTFNYNADVHAPYLSVMNGAKYYDMANDVSWGPRFDGRTYAPWYAWDPTHPKFGQMATWDAQPEDNLKELYKTGVTSTTNVAFSKSVNDLSIRTSFTNVHRTGLVENSDATRRYFSINADYKVNDRLKLTASYKYTYRRNHNAVAEGYGATGSATSTYTQWFNRNVKISDLKDYKKPDGTFRSWNILSPTNPSALYADSPWTIYNEIERISIDQWNVIAGTLKYDVLPDKLSVGAIFNGNMRYNYQERYAPEGLKTPTVGYYNHTDYPSQYQLMDTQIQGFVSYEDKFFDNKLDVQASAYVEDRRYRYDATYAFTTGGLIYNGYMSTSASQGVAQGRTSRTSYRSQSVYGVASAGWDRTYYLEASLRNDWSSTLPDSNNSYLYGGLSSSVILSNYLKNVRWLDFWKLRASMAQLGGTMDPYQVYETYSMSTKYNGHPTQYMAVTELDPNIKPTISTSWEIGTEFKLFKNRLWGDVSYYVKNSKNQIINMTTAPTSGYSARKMNAGIIQDKGFEISIGVTPIRTKDFEWEVYANLAKNENKLKELDKNDPDTKEYQLYWFSFSSRLYLYGVVGEPMGLIRGGGFEKDNNGNRIYNANGIPVVNTAAQYDLGSIQPDATGGFGTSFSWKGLRLSLGFDYQIGGQVASVTNMFGEGSGMLKSTVALNDRGVNIREDVSNGGGIKVTGVTKNADGTYSPYTGYADAQTYFEQKSLVWEDYVYDASYLKMRELSLSYAIPESLINKLNVGLTRASVSFIVQNPWLIHSSVPNMDASLIGGVTYGYIEGGNTFGTRTFGFTVNLTF